MYANATTLAERYHRQRTSFEDKLYLFPGYANIPFPIITADKQIQTAYWGLIPFWIRPKDDSEIAKKKAVEDAKRVASGNYNARYETVFEKASYKSSILRHRCIIPSTGYFEYHYKSKTDKQPYYIFLKNERIFSIAGIYEYWKNPLSGKEIMSFAMITGDANELTAWIHNGGNNPHRMPMILTREQEEKWLDPKLTKEQIQEFFNTYSAEDMDAYPISKDFQRMNPKDERIIKFVE